VIAWQIPDFSIEAYRDRLEAMHRYAFVNKAFTDMLFSRLAALNDVAGKRE
jgi:hypothetical protein